MELKPGYKLTEVGVIPEDWEATRLREICSMKSGESITGADIDRSSQYPCYGGNGLRGFTKRYTHDGCYSLIGRQGALCGNVIGAAGKFFASEHAIVVTALASTDIRWLTVVLGKMRLNQYSESSAQPGLSVSKLLDLVVVRPPTDTEQKAIAEALSDADALIESLDQLIAKKRQIKQGAMQELLTGKRRLPGFDGEWLKKSLGDLGEFLKGAGVSKDEALTGDLPCIRYGEIYTKHSDWIREFQSWVSTAVAATATRINYGDVLFAASGETKEEIGKCVAYVDQREAYAGGDIVILRTKIANPLFLGYYLNTESVRQQKSSRGQGDAVVHIGANSLAAIKIALPSMEEQTAIATVLRDMDTELAALESRLAKARQIKQGMMQELLTGRIRLL